MSVYPKKTIDKEPTLYVSKILMLGQSSVGKTSIVKRCAQNIFPQGNNLLTVGVDIRKVIKIYKNKHICLQIWDTAGQQKFKTLPSMYFKNVQGIILVYDIADSASFQQIESWIQKIDQNCSLNNLAITLVGNKLDLQQIRQVSSNDGMTFSKSKNINFKQTSAKSGQNIQQMINQIMATVIDKNLLVQRSSKKEITINNTQHPKQNQECC